MEQNEFETVDEAYNEVLRLRSKMQEIINQQPCCEGGGCFYPMHDGEGNYIGEQNVDPIGVIQGMAQTAQDALSPQASATQAGSPACGSQPQPEGGAIVNPPYDGGISPAPEGPTPEGGDTFLDDVMNAIPASQKSQLIDGDTFRAGMDRAIDVVTKWYDKAPAGDPLINALKRERDEHNPTALPTGPLLDVHAICDERDRLKEELAKYQTIGTVSGLSAAQMIEELAKQLTACRKELEEAKRQLTESPRWIPVSERMPTKEDGRWVEGEFNDEGYYEVLWMEKDGTILLATFNPSELGGPDNPSHWMPIPPLPKPQEDDGFEEWWINSDWSAGTKTESIARDAWNAALASRREKQKP